MRRKWYIVLSNVFVTSSGHLNPHANGEPVLIRQRSTCNIRPNLPLAVFTLTQYAVPNGLLLFPPTESCATLRPPPWSLTSTLLSLIERCNCARCVVADIKGLCGRKCARWETIVTGGSAKSLSRCLRRIIIPAPELWFGTLVLIFWQPNVCDARSARTKRSRRRRNF